MFRKVPAVSAVVAALGCAAHAAGRAPADRTPSVAVGEAVDLRRYERAWRDRSPHREGFLEVPGARLHYLEWGAPPRRSAQPDAGRPTLVLLPGAGQTAHVFDDLAPHFTDRYRVIALARRGTAPSTAAAADSGYSVAALTADIAGHSIAGGEITWLAAEHPERVGRLVYLDATYDYAGRVSLPPSPVPRPMLGPRDTALAAGRRWLARDFYGVWSDALEADLRAMGAKRRMDEEVRDLAAHPAPYARVRAPALVIVARATVRTAYPWLDPARDSQQIRAAQAYLTQVLGPLDRKAMDRVRREMRTARVMDLESPHHVFIARQEAVVRAMRAFLLTR